MIFFKKMFYFWYLIKKQDHPTDTSSCRDARTHLKLRPVWPTMHPHARFFVDFHKTSTDGLTNGPTDEWTYRSSCGVARTIKQANRSWFVFWGLTNSGKGNTLLEVRERLQALPISVIKVFHFLLFDGLADRHLIEMQGGTLKLWKLFQLRQMLLAKYRFFILWYWLIFWSYGHNKFNKKLFMSVISHVQW